MDSVSYSQFIAEIRQVINEATQNGRVVECKWLTHEIIQRHQDIKGNDVAWYTYCGYEKVAASVLKTIRERKGTEESEGSSDRQFVLPGYEFLQTSYVMRRDDKSVVVPTEQCSKDEMLTKADAMDRSIRGLSVHSREIRRYVANKWADATG